MTSNPYEFRGRVVLVTGGSEGIGAATARLFARYGADVVISGRTEATLQATARRIEAETGGRCLPVTADVCDKEQVERMVAETIAAFGRIDILINNVGWASQHVPFNDIGPAGWREEFALNLDSAYFCTKAAGRHFLAQRSGAIVNVSSVAGLHGVRHASAFSSAKAALQMLTRVAAGEWGPHIRINCVAPGLIATTNALEGARAANLDIDAICAGKPMQRAGMPEEVAHAIVFLASDAASYITGEVLAVRGGPTLGGGSE